MEYRNSYISPLGRILLTADEIGLTGLSNTDSFGRNRFSDVCVGDALHDPVWRDNDIRRNRKADRT